MPWESFLSAEGRSASRARRLTSGFSFEYAAAAVGEGLLAAVVPGGDHVGPEAACGLEEGVELDLTVAEHVGVGGAAAGVFVEQVVDHAPPVLLAEVHEVEGYAYLPRHELGHVPVFLPLAVAVERAFGVVPVLHEHGKHVVALPLEQECGHAGVDAA